MSIEFNPKVLEYEDCYEDPEYPYNIDDDEPDPRPLSQEDVEILGEIARLKKLIELSKINDPFWDCSNDHLYDDLDNYQEEAHNRGIQKYI